MDEFVDTMAKRLSAFARYLHSHKGQHKSLKAAARKYRKTRKYRKVSKSPTRKTCHKNLIRHKSHRTKQTTRQAKICRRKYSRKSKKSRKSRKSHKKH